MDAAAAAVAAAAAAQLGDMRNSVIDYIIRLYQLSINLSPLKIKSSFMIQPSAAIHSIAVIFSV